MKVSGLLMKLITSIFLLLPAWLLFACGSTTWPVTPASDFGFVLEFGSCNMDKLDTFRGEFTQDRVTEPSITISLRLSDEQMAMVYAKMLEINVASYPEVFEVPKPLVGEVVMISSPYNYALMVHNGESSISIRWTDDIVQPTTPRADRLRELFQLIIQIVREHPDYQQLPEVNFGCI